MHDDDLFRKYLRSETARPAGQPDRSGHARQGKAQQRSTPETVDLVAQIERIVGLEQDGQIIKNRRRR